jgi:type IV secretion system protein VirD4
MLRSDFHFSELRHRITSIFLVAPEPSGRLQPQAAPPGVSGASGGNARDAERSQAAQIAAQAAVST